VEGNVQALRRVIRVYHEHMEWKQYKHRADMARDLRNAEERVKELRTELALRERYIKHADERLLFHMLRWNPKKVHRLREILEVASMKGKAFSAKSMRLELGIPMPGLRRDLKELVELGLLVKPGWGRYRLAPDAWTDNPVRLIARRMARRDVEKRLREKSD
jgi:hypothetical protein